MATLVTQFQSYNRNKNEKLNTRTELFNTNAGGKGRVIFTGTIQHSSFLCLDNRRVPFI